jgi:type VI secretion system protein ImpA
MRRQDRADLPQGVWEHSLKTAEWEKIEATCVSALAEKSKDYQIAFWLTEAWFNRYGLEGFQRGIQLVHELVQRYWDTAHPQIRDGDVDFRVAPFVWLNESFSPQLRRIALTSSNQDEAGMCTVGDWEGALRLDRLRAKDNETYEKAEAAGKVTLERFLESAAKSKKSFLRPRYDLVVATETCLAALDAALDERLGKQGPSLRAVKQLVGTAKVVLEDSVFPAAGIPVTEISATPEEEAPVAEAPDHTDEQDVSPTEPSMLEGGKVVIKSREQAYELLELAADYLQSVEPHSPTPYLVRRAVSWGDKSLIGVLQEFLEDPKQVEWIADVLGIQR